MTTSYYKILKSINKHMHNKLNTYEKRLSDSRKEFNKILTQWNNTKNNLKQAVANTENYLNSEEAETELTRHWLKEYKDGVNEIKKNIPLADNELNNLKKELDKLNLQRANNFQMLEPSEQKEIINTLKNIHKLTFRESNPETDGFNQYSPFKKVHAKLDMFNREYKFRQYECLKELSDIYEKNPQIAIDYSFITNHLYWDSFDLINQNNQ